MTNEERIETTAPLYRLFLAFLKVALFGFGSGVVLAHRIAVERCRWLDDEEFTDIVSICQVMPGPNIVGIAVCVGAKARGLSGAAAAACGFILIPLMVGFLLGLLYLGHAHLAVFQNILGGVSAAAAGLLIATGIRMLMPHRHRPQALMVAAFALCGMALTKLPLIVVLLGAVLFSSAITAIERARAQ